MSDSNTGEKYIAFAPRFFICSIPVSYTHLDVYKRQEDDLCIKGILEKDNVIVLRNIIEFSETEGLSLIHI